MLIDKLAYYCILYASMTCMHYILTFFSDIYVDNPYTVMYNI
jgi:hypothetical protein